MRSLSCLDVGSMQALPRPCNLFIPTPLAGGTGVAVLTVDSLGRRPLLLGGVSAIVVALCALGASQISLTGQLETWTSVGALLLYVGAYQVCSSWRHPLQLSGVAMRVFARNVPEEDFVHEPKALFSPHFRERLIGAATRPDSSRLTYLLHASVTTSFPGCQGGLPCAVQQCQCPNV